jgi:transposase
MIPLHFRDQILSGTFEYALNYIVDNELDLKVFAPRFANDNTGAPAFDPAILLKIILYAYSRGITSSRRIAECCEDNIIFKALSCDTKPHFTTIANFISTMDKEISSLFRDVLLICTDMNLVGKTMFAIDGCKMPSYASKEWSGTTKDFEKKKEKIEKAIAHIMNRHRTDDGNEQLPKNMEQEEKRHLEKLQRKSKKIQRWLERNKDKIGKAGQAIKSNITDNESAKMKTSRGVIQGYNGVAVVDSKHQVIVNAEAFGKGQEQELLKPIIEGTQENFKAIESKEDILKKSRDNRRQRVSFRKQFKDAL